MTQTHRVYNFSAGPAVLPEIVLKKAQQELLNYQNCGMSVLEMSHRSREFDQILLDAENKLRQILQLSDDTAVLFLQGGATLQFGMLPLNLIPNPQNSAPIDFIHSGYWTQMAMEELKRIGCPYRILASGESAQFKQLPELPNSFNPEAPYAYVCSNNTIYGTQWKNFPTPPESVPLVCDMSSDFLSRSLNFNQFGVIFAGAQKNVGPAGVCIVLIKKHLVEKAPSNLPIYLQYRTHVKAGSRYNTPPTFSIYMCKLMLDWIEIQGGLTAIEKKNEAKAKLLYDAIDQSEFYSNPVHPSHRSLMNVIFRISPNVPEREKLEELFAEEATQNGLVQLKGHRATGGLRASIYNAFPIEGVQALTHFMKDFEKRMG